MMPPVPRGEKGWKFSLLITGSASQMKAPSATSFTATSTALIVAARSLSSPTSEKIAAPRMKKGKIENIAR